MGFGTATSGGGGSREKCEFHYAAQPDLKLLIFRPHDFRPMTGIIRCAPPCLSPTKWLNLLPHLVNENSNDEQSLH